MQNTMRTAQHNRQRGATLIISMLFLVMLTLIGISSLGSSKLEQRMAHNYQLNGYVFQAAESAIDDAIASGSMNYFSMNAGGGTVRLDNPLYVNTDDLYQKARTAGKNVVLPPVAYNPDTGTLGAVTITATESVVFRGPMPPPAGMSMTSNLYHAARYDVTGTASINGTGASATHVAGTRYIMPGPAN